MLPQFFPRGEEPYPKGTSDVAGSGVVDSVWSEYSSERKPGSGLQSGLLKAKSDVAGHPPPEPEEEVTAPWSDAEVISPGADHTAAENRGSPG